MSRDNDIDSALDSILEGSGSRDTNDPQVQIYNLLNEMSEADMLKVKKQVDHLVEKREGERRRMRERVQANEKDMNSTLDGLI